VVFYGADAASGVLSVAHASGSGESVVRDICIQLGKGLSGWVAATGGAMTNADAVLDLGDRIHQITPAPQSALCTALVHEGAVIGVMALYAPGADAFSTAQARSMDLASGPIAAALAAARRCEDDRRIAFTDGLTNLPNEHHLQALLADDSWLERTCTRRRAVVAIRVPSALLLVETDMLQQAVAAVREAAPRPELLFRSAPDELIVLLPDTSADAARRIRARVLASFADVSLLTRRPALVGLGGAPADGHRWEELVATARARRDVLLDDGLGRQTYATA
jgi:GGDEF domain-containing protein